MHHMQHQTQHHHASTRHTHHLRGKWPELLGVWGGGMAFASELWGWKTDSSLRLRTCSWTSSRGWEWAAATLFSWGTQPQCSHREVVGMFLNGSLAQTNSSKSGLTSRFVLWYHCGRTVFPDIFCALFRSSARSFAHSSERIPGDLPPPGPLSRTTSVRHFATLMQAKTHPTLCHTLSLC